MRTKTYIAFDGDADLMSYRTIQGWSADKNNPFTLNDAHDVNEARDNSMPESIINQLRERMEVSLGAAGCWLGRHMPAKTRRRSIQR